MDLFEQMPVVSGNPLSLLGQVKTRANVGGTSKNPKAQVLTTRDDNRRTVHARQMHSTDNPDAKTVRRSIVHPEKSVSMQSSFNLKRSVNPEFDNGFNENCSHVERRSDGQTSTVGMGTHCERGVHTSGKEEYTARTRGEDDEVRDERQHKRIRRSVSKEQNRAARRVQGTQHSVVRARDKTAADQKDQGGTGRARTTATSNPGLRTTQRKDVRMGICSRQTVLRVGSDDNRRGSATASPQLRKFATHVEQSLGTSPRVTSSPRRKVHSQTTKLEPEEELEDLVKRVEQLQAIVRQRKTTEKSSAT